MPEIVMCGIPRSGSTLVWQILSAVFPHKEILKTHPDIWTPDGSMAVVSIRNPHDVVASLYRVRLSRAGREWGDEEDINNVVRRMSDSYEALERVLRGPHVLLRYEEFWNNHSVIYRMVEETFGEYVPLQDRAHISRRFSVEENHKRASRLSDFNEVDEFQIHGDHIGKVVPGYWEQALPHWALKQVVVECWDVSKRWGYENQ